MQSQTNIHSPENEKLLIKYGLEARSIHKYIVENEMDLIITNREPTAVDVNRILFKLGGKLHPYQIYNCIRRNQFKMHVLQTLEQCPYPNIKSQLEDSMEKIFEYSVKCGFEKIKNNCVFCS